MHMGVNCRKFINFFETFSKVLEIQIFKYNNWIWYEKKKKKKKKN